MVTVTYLPLFVTILLRGMPGIWKSRHRLLFGWLVFMQALYPGRQTLAELARWTPGSITAWRFRRLLKATYGHVHLLVEWWVQEAFATLPPPQDGTVYLGGDGSVKPTRGTPHPVAQKGRQSAHPPWVGGVRCALLIATWESSRFPVAFRLLRPTTHPEYRTAKAWCRAMVSHFVPPTWAKRIMVTGDAAYGSQEKRQLVLKREADDPVRRWGCVCAIARTWKTVEDNALKDLGTH